MSTGNPKKAIAAILPPSLDVGGFTVRPMTLGMFAALERIDSPLVTGEDAKDTLSLIPSLYLLTHDPREIFAGNLLDRALVWADTVPVETMAEIRAACAQQLQTMLDVIPQRDDDEKKKKKAMTAGSPASSTLPPRSSDGASGISSGKSRRPQSCSSTGKTRSTPTKSSRSR